MSSGIEVHLDRCLGNGNCARTAPSYFDQNDIDGRVIVLETDVAADDLELVQEAVRLCPVRALRVEFDFD